MLCWKKAHYFNIVKHDFLDKWCYNFLIYLRPFKNKQEFKNNFHDQAIVLFIVSFNVFIYYLFIYVLIYYLDFLHVRVSFSDFKDKFPI